MNMAEMTRLAALIASLAHARDDIRAAALCGSWARGDARIDPDLDILIIARNIDVLQANQEWLRKLNFADAGFRCIGHEYARYGAVWSAHVQLQPIAALELTFADVAWASVDPVDPGTRHVVNDAFQNLVDKDFLLSRLVSQCAA